MFSCLAAIELHESLGSLGGPAAIVPMLAGAILASSIALWVLADAQQRYRSVHYDFGTFVFFAWPVLGPIYLFSTRGWRGFAPLGWFLLLYIAAAIVGTIPWFIATGQ